MANWKQDSILLSVSHSSKIKSQINWSAHLTDSRTWGGASHALIDSLVSQPDWEWPALLGSSPVSPTQIFLLDRFDWLQTASVDWPVVAGEMLRCKLLIPRSNLQIRTFLSIVVEERVHRQLEGATRNEQMYREISEDRVNRKTASSERRPQLCC